MTLSSLHQANYPRFVDRDMVMRHHRKGGVGHVDPVQCARHCILDAAEGGPCGAVQEEIDSDGNSDECSSLAGEDVDTANESDMDMNTESFEMPTSNSDTDSL
jgi:hypothetical protein